MSFIHGDNSIGNLNKPLTANNDQKFFKDKGFWYMSNDGKQYHRVTDPKFATQIEKWAKANNLFPEIV